ncbi:MAG: hypothetical protein ACE5H0_10805 [Bacteroidota bacterium]
MTARGTRLLRWVYVVYSVLVVATTLYLLYVRDPDYLTFAENFFLALGIILWGLVGGVHLDAPMEPFIATVNIVVYLAAPLVIRAIIRWCTE